MSLFGATRPLIACRGIVGIDCHRLVLSTILATSLLVAMIVAGGGTLRPSHQVSADHYLESLTELGRLEGARFAATPFNPDADPDIVEAARSSALRAGDRRRFVRRRGRRAELPRGRLPPVRVREDPRRDVLVVDEINSDGSFRAAFAVSPDNTSGLLGSLALVLGRFYTERRRLARWRAERVGATRGEDYRSPERAAEPITGGVLSRVVDANERRAATVVLAGLVAFIAATPLAAALFVIGH